MEPRDWLGVAGAEPGHAERRTQSEDCGPAMPRCARRITGPGHRLAATRNERVERLLAKLCPSHQIFRWTMPALHDRLGTTDA